MSFCADYAIEMAKLSQFFKRGVAPEFLDLFRQLRERKDLNLDVKMALQLSHAILKSGPLGPVNFMKAFEFATKEFEFDKKKALEFAGRMADRSFVGERPPIMQYVPEATPIPMPTPFVPPVGSGGGGGGS
jgi:hypothetical protein